MNKFGQMIIKSNSPSGFDCDDSLVIWPKDFRVNKPGRIEFDYGSEKVYLIPHSYHVIFLKHCFNRGDFVIIWSANGFDWAKQVVDKLGLENHYNCIMQKVVRHVDDKTSISSIVGNHIFVPHETYDGGK
jgi:hypothetical protein